MHSAKFEAGRTDGSQATIFVNGWNTGVYIGDIGPQKSFTIPSGFLNMRGENEISIAVAAKTAGMGPQSITLDAVHSTTGGLCRRVMEDGRSSPSFRRVLDGKMMPLLYRHDARRDLRGDFEGEGEHTC